MLHKTGFVYLIFLIGCSNQFTKPELLTPVSTILMTPTIGYNLLTTPIQPVITKQADESMGKLLLSDQNAIYLSDPSGGQIQKVITLTKPIYSMALSPDGKKIAYFDENALLIQDLLTDEIKQPQMPFMSNPDYSLAWSPDGAELIFSCAAENLPYISICAFNIKMEVLRTILDARVIGINDLNTWVRFKSLSQDGTKIIFVVNPIPQLGDPDKSIIYILDTTTNLITVVFDSQEQSNISDITNVAISPDTKTILFGAKIEGKNQIFRINSDGSELQQITNNRLDTMFPFWSPDGKYFYASVYTPNTLDVQLTLFKLNGEVINIITLADIRLWGWFSQ